MRARRVLVVVLAVVGLLGAAAAFAATVRISWGYAIEVPGLAALNTRGDAKTTSVSCGGAGKCEAGGSYKNGTSRFEAFVVSEKSAEWGRAIEVPGTAALDVGHNAETTSVSCTASNCAAAGDYEDGSGHSQAFVVNETNGVWGNAIEVPGTAALNTGGTAGTTSVSCRGFGNCTAAGFYKDGSAHFQTFVVDEKNGVWGNAIEVPGTAALNAGANSSVQLSPVVSCASAGNCVAGGRYMDGSGRFQVFVVSEKHGVWGSAIEVPATAALNSGGSALLTSVSCGGVGDCSAGGYYTDGSSRAQAFVVSAKKWIWGTAVEVPGTAALNGGGSAQLTSVSCAAVGQCAAGGSYRDASLHDQAFVAREKNGVWHGATAVPAMAALNTGGSASVTSVSCPGVGNCAAVGTYTQSPGRVQAFAVAQKNGVWGKAREVPGIAALNLGLVDVTAVSCAKSGACAVGGVFSDGGSVRQGFVTAP